MTMRPAFSTVVTAFAASHRRRGCAPRNRQRGAGIIAAIAAIVVFSLLGATLNQMHQSSTHSTIEQHSGTDAFIAAEAGLNAAALFMIANCDPLPTLPTTLTGTIGDDGYTVVIADDGGGTLTLTSVGESPANDPAQRRTLTRTAYNCATTGSGSPIAAGASLTVAKDVEINDNDVPKVGEGSANNVINPDGSLGSISAGEISLPTLSPATFPSSDGTEGDKSNATNLTAGHYEDVTVTSSSGNPTFTGGGTFYIDSLTVGQEDTIRLRPGSYYINHLSMAKESRLIVEADPGDPDADVVIYIGNSASIAKETELNDIDPDSAQDVEQLQIHLYPGANLSIAKETEFTGLLYGYSGSSVSMAKEAEFTGAINSTGSVTLAKEIELTFDEYVEAAVANTSGGSSGSAATSGTWMESAN